MYKGYIYKATNKVNGKVYIGQTNDFKRRKKEHLMRAFYEKDAQYGNKFYRAIRKHGADNFEWSIVEEKSFGTEDEKYSWINEKERNYVDVYNSFYNGYNMTFGGEGASTGLVGELSPFYGRTGDKHACSIKILQYDKKGNFIKGYIGVAETARLLGVTSQGITHCLTGVAKSVGAEMWQFRYNDGDNYPNRISPVIHDVSKTEVDCFSLDGKFIKRFLSAPESAEYCSIRVSDIWNCLCGKQKSSGGFMFVKAENNPNKKDIPPYKKGSTSIPIVQLDEDGSFIKEWKSVTEAAEFFDVVASNIIVCCKGKMWRAYGYRWMYKSKYEQTGYVKKVEKPSRATGVDVFTKDGVFLEQCISQKEASEKYGVCISKISAWCNGKVGKARKYMFRYTK